MQSSLNCRWLLSVTTVVVSIMMLICLWWMLPGPGARAAPLLEEAPRGKVAVPTLHGVKTATGVIYPDMAFASSEDRLILVWTDYFTQSVGNHSVNVYAQLFDNNGVTLTAPLTVATNLVYEANRPVEVDVSMSISGEAMIAFDHLYRDGGLSDIGVRRIVTESFTTGVPTVIGTSNRIDIDPAVDHVKENTYWFGYSQLTANGSPTARFNVSRWNDPVGASQVNVSISSSGYLTPLIAANAEGYAIAVAVLGTPSNNFSARLFGPNSSLSASAAHTFPFGKVPDLTALPGVNISNTWRLATLQGTAQDPYIAVYRIGRGANDNVAPSIETTATVTVTGVYTGVGPKILVDSSDGKMLVYQTGTTTATRSLVTTRFNANGTQSGVNDLMSGASVSPIFAVARGQYDTVLSGWIAAVTQNEFNASVDDLVDFEVRMFAPLLAVDDSLEIDEDGVLTASVASNDLADANINPLYSTTSSVSHGALAFAANGNYVYTPTADFHGTDSFTYQIVNDLAFSSTALVSITVLSQPDYLSVTRSGDGSGVVHSLGVSPTEIDCGGSCSALVADGITVTLFTTPTFGSSFTGWNGSCSGFGMCVVEMDPGRTVDAIFTRNLYGVNVASAGSGSVAQSPNQGTHPFGEVMTLTATPATGWSFVGWSGDSVSQDNPLSMVVTTTNQYTANFTLNSYAVGVTVAGSGDVQKSPEQGTYPFGEVMTLTATPAHYWSFVGWSGDNSSQDNPLSVVVTTTNQYTANFTLNSYAVDVAVAGSGDVQKSPEQGTYPFGDVMTLTATPATGWSFAGWSGDSVSQDNPLSVVVSATNQYTANFSLNSYAVEVTVLGDGSVQKSPDQALYNYGTQVTLTAVPISEAWTFVNWSGETVSGTLPSVVLTVGLENEVQATFRELGVPVPVNDAFTTRPNTPTAGNLLTNDSDPEGGTLRIESLGNTGFGSVTVDEEGNFQYIGQPGFVGVDTLEYTVINEVGRSATARIFVVVEEEAPSSSQPELFFPAPDQPMTEVIETGDMTLTVQLPAGYLGNVLSPADVFYYVFSPIADAALPGTAPDLKFAGLYFSLDVFLNEDPLENPTFDPPLRMTIEYTDGDVGEGVESEMTMQYWDEEANAWSNEGITVVEHDMEANRIVFDIAHLSEFALFVGQVPTALPSDAQPDDSRVQMFLPSVHE